MRERGLKYENDELPLTRVIVAPHAGAWIEINPGLRIRRIPRCRSPCGGRGLKYIRSVSISNGFLVAPHAGGRGLK